VCACVRACVRARVSVHWVTATQQAGGRRS
jgi:hypothetical protein